MLETKHRTKGKFYPYQVSAEILLFSYLFLEYNSHFFTNFRVCVRPLEELCSFKFQCYASNPINQDKNVLHVLKKEPRRQSKDLKYEVRKAFGRSPNSTMDSRSCPSPKSFSRNGASSNHRFPLRTEYSILMGARL